MTAWPYDLERSLIVTAPPNSTLRRRFGRNLRRAMHAHDLSDKRVSHDCGIGETSVLYYKMGSQRFPSTVHALRLATYLGITLFEAYSPQAPTVDFGRGLERRLEGVEALRAPEGELMRRYGETITRLMAERGYNQAAVRRLILCNKPAISFTVAGKRLPTQSFCVLASGLFGVGPLEMLTGLNDMDVLGRVPEPPVLYKPHLERVLGPNWDAER